MITPFRKWALLSFVPALVVMFAGAGLNVYVDPLRVFHDSPALKDRYYKDMRNSGAGYIREYIRKQRKYDSLIVGSSLSNNFLPDDVRQTLNWPAPMQLSWGASRPYEQFVALQYALEGGTIKNVLWEVNFAYSTNELGQTLKNKRFQENLYTDNPFSKLPYIFSIETFEDSLGILSHGELFPERRLKWAAKFKNMNYWMSRALKKGRDKKFVSPENRVKLQKAIDSADARAASEKGECPPPHFPCVEGYLLSTIRNNPDVRFELFYPPVSSLMYRLITPCQLQNYLHMRTYLAKAVASLPNANISSFDSIPRLTEDITNYIDRVHYTAEISKNMLHWIQSGKYRETPENVSSNNAILLEKTRNLRVLDQRAAQ